VPELKDKTLVLDFATIAGIFLNNVTRWNDQRIKDLNTPEVAALLPAQPIIVISQSIQSAVTRLFTAVLSARVPEFASLVRSAAYQPTKPLVY
jgi:ABC-type phosphate transport system substrate-binding protein